MIGKHGSLCKTTVGCNPLMYPAWKLVAPNSGLILSLQTCIGSGCAVHWCWKGCRNGNTKQGGWCHFQAWGFSAIGFFVVVSFAIFLRRQISPTKKDIRESLYLFESLQLHSLSFETTYSAWILTTSTPILSMFLWKQAPLCWIGLISEISIGVC